jgi:cysteine desulfurase
MIYLDNAACTRLDERVLEAMKPYFFDTYAVATSEVGYSMGIDAKEGLEKAREGIASNSRSHSQAVKMRHAGRKACLDCSLKRALTQMLKK